PSGIDHWRATCIERCPRGSVGSCAEKGLPRHLAAQLTRYITNNPDMTADEVVDQARQRCNQENLISQLKSDVRALHAPVNTLNANWAYMTVAALAWALKAWSALLLPVTPRWAEQHNEQRRRLLTMEFRTFRQAFIEIPCQIITTGRRVRWRVLAYNQWLGAFFRLIDAL
ncbi:MAG: hypothetical protein ACLP01_30035, partial [Solirubrobacteraceae bacterium]